MLKQIATPLTIAVVILIVALPFLSGERLQWQLASINEQILAGDSESALTQLNRLVDENPENAQVRLARAELLLHSGQAELAFEDIVATRNPSPDNLKPAGESAVPIRLNVSATFLYLDVLMSLQRYPEAIALIEQLYDPNTQPIGAALYSLKNLSAYVRALSRIEKEQQTALEDISIAVDSLPSEPDLWAYCGRIAQTLDEIPEAQKHYDRAIRLVATKHSADQNGISRKVYDLSCKGLPLSPAENSEVQALINKSGALRSKVEQWEKTRNALAALPSTTANNTSRSDALNRHHISQAELNEAMDTLTMAAAYYDTRGCVLTAMNDPDLAELDFDLAIAWLELVIKAKESLGPPNLSRIPRPEEVALADKEDRKSLAVMYYHRALMFRDSQRPEREQRDLEKVKSLGFTPSPTLH
jgi:tetratricopeptide (TPR) repeat protein